ncbi:hypothetical protein [Paenibacillus campi]|uniref:hypothetical protein n=1 Tax=Paenibacillus campi TaxID=3106031 RepID=UPI002AFE8586|nr:hypothetical protein [Paenibacillus sp. SGZ-1014]
MTNYPNIDFQKVKAAYARVLRNIEQAPIHLSNRGQYKEVSTIEGKYSCKLTINTFGFSVVIYLRIHREYCEEILKISSLCGPVTAESFLPASEQKNFNAIINDPTLCTMLENNIQQFHTCLIQNRVWENPQIYNNL